MAPSAIAQRRTHNLLLFQKLLNLREGASPFTLLLDTVEQTAKPVTREFMSRAKASYFILHGDLPRYIEIMSETSWEERYAQQGCCGWLDKYFVTGTP
jgi:elongator complex protein 5